MPDRKYLLLKGCAGLGNRLITLCSALAFARRTGRDLLVDWNDGLYFRKGYNFFSDYFELLGVDYFAPNSDQLVDSIPANATIYPRAFEAHLADHLYDHYHQVLSAPLSNLYARAPSILPAKFGGMWVNSGDKKQVKLSVADYLFRSIDTNSFPLGGYYKRSGPGRCCIC